MSVPYKLVKCNIRSSKNYGKYYAKAVRGDIATQRTIEGMIQKNCSVKESDVRAVIKEMVETMKELLAMGKTIQIDELGSFSISLKSNCVNDPAQFSVKDIIGADCVFTPWGQRRSDGSRKIVRYILKGLKYRPVS